MPCAYRTALSAARKGNRSNYKEGTGGKRKGPSPTELQLLSEGQSRISQGGVYPLEIGG